MGLDIDEPSGFKGEKGEGYMHSFDRPEYLARPLQADCSMLLFISRLNAGFCLQSLAEGLTTASRYRERR